MATSASSSAERRFDDLHVAPRAHARKAARHVERHRDRLHVHCARAVAECVTTLGDVVVNDEQRGVIEELAREREEHLEHVVAPVGLRQELHRILRQERPSNLLRRLGRRCRRTHRDVCVRGRRLGAPRRGSVGRRGPRTARRRQSTARDRHHLVGVDALPRCARRSEAVGRPPLAVVVLVPVDLVRAARRLLLRQLEGATRDLGVLRRSHVRHSTRFSSAELVREPAEPRGHVDPIVVRERGRDANLRDHAVENVVPEKERKLLVDLGGERRRDRDDQRPALRGERNEAMLLGDLLRNEADRLARHAHDLLARRRQEPVERGAIRADDVLGRSVHLEQDALQITARDDLTLDRFFDLAYGDDLVADQEGGQDGHVGSANSNRGVCRKDVRFPQQTVSNQRLPGSYSSSPRLNT